MKYLIALISAALAFGAWADNRIEVGNDYGGHHCHSQWNQGNADDEFKHTCKAYAQQDGNNGTYDAQAVGSFLMQKSLVNAPLPAKPVFRKVFVTTCDQGTAGTIQDDNGNAYTTTNCKATIVIRGYPKINPDVEISYRLVLRNATAADEVEKSISGYAGTSIMMRPGMGIVEPSEVK